LSAFLVYERGIAVVVVENALLIAAVRRLIRSNTDLPLSPVRSLAYFLPVIQEVLQLRVGPDYFHYLRQKLERLTGPR
jgi:hypothetical protein